jgi:hypothetical protein
MNEDSELWKPVIGGLLQAWETICCYVNLSCTIVACGHDVLWTLVFWSWRLASCGLVGILVMWWCKQWTYLCNYLSCVAVTLGCSRRQRQRMSTFWSRLKFPIPARFRCISVRIWSFSYNRLSRSWLSRSRSRSRSRWQNMVTKTGRGLSRPFPSVFNPSHEVLDELILEVLLSMLKPRINNKLQNRHARMNLLYQGG